MLKKNLLSFPDFPNSYFAKHNLQVYLGLCQIYDGAFLAINYLRKKAPSFMLDRVLNVCLQYLSCFRVSNLGTIPT